MCCIGHVTRKSVLYGQYRTGGTFDPPTQNTIYVYIVVSYSDVTSLHWQATFMDSNSDILMSSNMRSIIWYIILCVICKGIVNVVLAYIIQDLWGVFVINGVKALFFMVLGTCVK